MVEVSKLDPGARDRLVRRWGKAPEAELRTGSRAPPRIIAGWFRDWIGKELRELGLPAGQRVRAILTLDPLAQLYAQLSVNGVARDAARGVDRGAALAMSPDGAVRAMVGGVDFARRQHNLATQELLAPASTFKLFVFLAALEAGLEPSQVVLDEPIRADGRPWPENFERRYRGRIPLIDAVAHSSNAATVRVSESLGREKVIELARRLGLTTALRPEPSLALGTSEVRMVELAAAYAALIGDGHRARAYGVLAVQSKTGAIVRWHRPSVDKVLDDRVVAKMNRMLRAVVSRGTASQVGLPARVIGKTGTAPKGREAWFVGLTGDLVGVFWFARAGGATGSQELGGKLPAAAYARFVRNLYDDRALPPLR